MSDTQSAKGNCLCGAVTLHASTLSTSVGACHCGMCRKWNGGPGLALQGGTAVTINGEENVAIYDSSEWAERGFCKQCGSNLFYRMKDNQEYYLLAGLFELDNLKFDHQIYVDHKPDYYDFANDTQMLTEADIIAMHEAGGDQ